MKHPHIRFLFVAAITVFLSGCITKTVPYVDINRYMGTWYQISANPTPFSGDLVGVTAQYSLQDDGSVRVYNSGYKNTLDGEFSDIVGRAVVVDKNSNSKLKVTFPGAPNFPFPNYLIVVLDEVDYQYAVVTDPLQQTLFVLNRTPQMDEDLYQKILAELRSLRIKTNKLVRTPQRPASDNT